jgi:hypothetical protein
LKSTTAAIVFSGLIAGTVAFQLALVVGAPWGFLAWGGRYEGVLPPGMRVASAGSICVLAALALVVLVRAGLLLPRWHVVARKAIWGVVGYCALGIVANGITPSVWERNIWLPVTLLLFGTSMVVARGKQPEEPRA